MVTLLAVLYLISVLLLCIGGVVRIHRQVHDLEPSLTKCDLASLPDKQRSMMVDLDREATESGFRSFGSAAYDAGTLQGVVYELWWNGDLGLCLIGIYAPIRGTTRFVHTLVARLPDGRVAKVTSGQKRHPFDAHRDDITISLSPRVALNEMIEALVSAAGPNPFVRGWPAPGGHWDLVDAMNTAVIADHVKRGRFRAIDGRRYRYSLPMSMVTILRLLPLPGALRSWRINRRSRRNVAALTAS